MAFGFPGEVVDQMAKSDILRQRRHLGSFASWIRYACELTPLVCRRSVKCGCTVLVGDLLLSRIEVVLNVLKTAYQLRDRMPTKRWICCRFFGYPTYEILLVLGGPMSAYMHGSEE